MFSTNKQCDKNYLSHNDRLNLSFKEVCKQAEKWKKNSINHLQLEFAFGGNIRFEEGSTADLW